MALRRRLEGVAHVSISQSQQTAAVTFNPGSRAFSAPAFRDALGEAAVEVVSLEIDACGVIEEMNGHRWITITGQRFLLRGQTSAGSIACVTGRLNDRVEPNELEVMKALAAR